MSITDINTCSTPGAVKLTMGFDAALSDPTQCLPLLLEYVYFEGARNPTHMLNCGIFAAVALTLLFFLLELEAYFTIQDPRNREYYSQKYSSSTGQQQQHHLQGVLVSGPRQLGKIVAAGNNNHNMGNCNASSGAAYNLLA
jgi:hypothetical protein